jgi:hypothetical protein
LLPDSTAVTWKEEVLRSLSMSFLSGGLSSTARTWNGVAAAAMVSSFFLVCLTGKEDMAWESWLCLVLCG